MPGINVKDWKYSGAAKKVRRSKHEKPFLSYLGSMLSGEVPAKEVMNTLRIPPRSFEGLVSKMKNSASNLCMKMNDIGVTYQVVGKGRGAKSSLIKV